QGAVSTTIQFLGSLSGSLDLGVYTDDPSAPNSACVTDLTKCNPGIIGRVTLGLDSSSIPGVTFQGDFVLNVNLFLKGSGTEQIVTFQTCADSPTGATNCTGSAAGSTLLARDSSQNIRIGNVNIKSGLELDLHGTMTIGGLIDIKGGFQFTFTPSPFVISIVATASISLHGLGDIGGGGFKFAGGFQIDKDGLALYVSIDAGAMANFGSSLKLGFSATAVLTFSTAAFTKQIGGTFTVPSGFTLKIAGSVNFLNVVTADGEV